MKKIISILLVLVFSICLLTACGGETTAPPSSQTPPASEASKDPSVMDELRKLKELEGKNEKLVAVYNEVAALAVKNGWDADEMTVKELNAVNVILKTFNEMLRNPSSAHGADLDEILSAADELAVELDTNMRNRVSKKYTK